MDRNTVTGLILIFFIMMAWFYFTMPTEEEMQQREARQTMQDSLAAARADTLVQQQEEARQQPAVPAVRADEETGDLGMFSGSGVSDTTRIVVETPRYTAVFSNLGAGVARFTLNEYETWDQRPVQMIADTTRSAWSVGFLSNENYNIDTDRILFEQVTPGNSFRLESGETVELEYVLNLENGGSISYTYHLNGDTFEIDLAIGFNGLDQNIIGGTIDFGWKPRLGFTERDRIQEGQLASAYAYTGGEMEQLLITEPGRQESNFNGDVDWVSTRTKFFTQIIEPVNPTDGALLIGEVGGSTDNPNTVHRYQSFIRSDIPADGIAEYRMYVGPLAYNQLKQFDPEAYNMVNVGYFWMRWFSEPLVRYLIIPYFGFVGGFMNYGLAIILFAILVKVVLYPLTKKSFKSMAAMKELQPQMKEIQEKYKDNPQKQQQATMQLYKKAKVNPLGGCIPNLLQFPILITLWRFFQNSILIRQQEFLWAGDLSAPDYILSFPFSIPFLGEQVAGFVLLMTGAMAFQSKLTGGMSSGGAGGGQMKALQYMLPVMLLFIFNNFAAGLSLYYLIYNIVSIGQQLLINRQIEHARELEKE